MVVIGGGPIGTELAQAFCRLGSQVAILDQASQFLSREDEDAAALLTTALRKDGVNICLNAKVKKITVDGATKRVHVSVGDQQQIFDADHILVGAGRAPNVEGMNLEKVHVDYDRFGVKVNDFLETSNPRVFAAGDICSPYKFTHTADAAARIVIQNALFSIGPFGKKRF